MPAPINTSEISRRFAVILIVKRPFMRSSLSGKVTKSISSKVSRYTLSALCPTPAIVRTRQARCSVGSLIHLTLRFLGRLTLHENIDCVVSAPFL